MNTLTLGIPTGGRFRIGFDYYAHGQLYSDEFDSPFAMPQNQRILIVYNPLNPRENSRTGGTLAPVARPSLIGLGITGSILLSLLWLFMLHGCS